MSRTVGVVNPISQWLASADSWKPQAGGHVTGPCRRSISGQNDLLLSSPSGVLSLSFAAILSNFLRLPFFALHPTINCTPGRGLLWARLILKLLSFFFFLYLKTKHSYRTQLTLHYSTYITQITLHNTTLLIALLYLYYWINHLQRNVTYVIMHYKTKLTIH